MQTSTFNDEKQMRGYEHHEIREWLKPEHARVEAQIKRLQDRIDLFLRYNELGRGHPSKQKVKERERIRWKLSSTERRVVAREHPRETFHEHPFRALMVNIFLAIIFIIIIACFTRTEWHVCDMSVELFDGFQSADRILTAEFAKLYNSVPFGFNMATAHAIFSAEFLEHGQSVFEIVDGKLPWSTAMFLSLIALLIMVRVIRICFQEISICAVAVREVCRDVYAGLVKNKYLYMEWRKNKAEGLIKLPI